MMPGTTASAILGFYDVDHMVVRVRLVLDEDLADHADAHLAWDVAQRQVVEGLHDLLGHTLDGRYPFLMPGLGGGLGGNRGVRWFRARWCPQLIQLVGQSPSPLRTGARGRGTS